MIGLRSVQLVGLGGVLFLVREYLVVVIPLPKQIPCPTATRLLELGDRRIVEVEPRFCFLVVAICRVVPKVERAKVVYHAIQIVNIIIQVVVWVLLIQILIHIQA